MHDAKHTPGPWRHEIDISGGDFIITTANGLRTICDAHVHHDASDYDRMVAECAANARLIAAAPAMLEALRAVASPSMSESRPMRGESSIGWQAGDGMSALERLALVRAAIAAATGE